MGAGILPTAIYNNKLYFLFGKENEFEKTAPGFADFGGGTEKGETPFKTAIREGSEELMGFLGSPQDIKKLIQKHYLIVSGEHKYHTYIFPYEYNTHITDNYNNSYKFFKHHLDNSIIKTDNKKIFEKDELKWYCIDDLIKDKKKFRFFYVNTLYEIIKNKKAIYNFIKKTNNKISSSKTQKNKTS